MAPRVGVEVAGSAQAYVALLRAVNVGGTGKLSMAELRAIVERAGGTGVRTYIQSGNVVFRHRGRSAGPLAGRLEEAIRRDTGLDTSVIVRTASELGDVVAANPFPERPTSSLHVAFFPEDVPSSETAMASLGSFPPEEAVARGRELYLYLPNGVGRAKLPTVLRRLPLPSTVRNWRTVTTLCEMAVAPPS